MAEVSSQFAFWDVVQTEEALEGALWHKFVSRKSRGIDFWPYRLNCFGPAMP